MARKIVWILAFSALTAIAQTVPRSGIAGSETRGPEPVKERLLSAQKQFPPDVWSDRERSISVLPRRSSCVYPQIDTRSIVFRRCTPTQKIRLLPSIKPLPDSPPK
jgi:hypothetical protein